MIYKNKLEKEIISEENIKYLKLEFSINDIEEFEIDCINSMQNGALNINKSIFNSIMNLKYDISNLKSLREIISDNEIDKNKLVKILVEISQIIKSYELLKSNNFILNKEWIFIDSKENIKMIYIPTKEEQCENINMNYMNMVIEIIDDIYILGNIKKGNADSLMDIKAKAKNENMSIDKFIELVKSECCSNSKNNSKNTEKNEQNIIKKNILDNKNSNINTNKNTTDEKVEYIKPLQIEKNQLNNAEKIDGENEESIKIVEKQRYKLSRIISTIIIQPIMLLIIVVLFFIVDVEMMQSIGGSILFLILDGIIVKSLLDPAKKETVKIKVRVKNKTILKNDKTESGNIQDKTIQNKIIVRQKIDNDEIERQRIQNEALENQRKENEKMISESLERKKIENKDLENNIDSNIRIKQENSNSFESDFDEDTDETTILSDETEILSGNEGQAIYLDIDNGVRKVTEELVGDRYVIGRSHNLSKFMTNNEASREHAEIFNANNKYYLRDLNSKNGTRLNGEIIEKNKAYLLEDGFIIQIANLKITFRL